MPVPIKYNANALALLFQQCQKNVLLISSTFNGFQGIRLILQSCIFSQFIIQFLFIKQAMNQSEQKREKELISVCKSIQSLIKSKSLKISDEIIADWLTIINVQQYRSAALIQQIRNTRDLLLKQTSTKNHQTYSEEQQLKTNAYLSLAITSEILKNGQVEYEYRIALSYDQRHPQINLSLALLLYHLQEYREALKYISKVTVKTAFIEKHRINIWNILVGKVENSLCQQLSKTDNSEQHIAKVQFIRKVMKFKEAFLYHSAEIQSLSQQSYLQIAWLLYCTNRFADGLTLAYKLRNLNQPPTQIIQQNLANLFFMFSKFEESAECAKQGLKINPRNQQIHKYLIQSLILLQQIPKAKVCAMGLINLNKYNGQAYQLMGQILSIQGSKQLGLEYSKLGVVIQPSETTYSWLADQFSNNSIFASAQRCYLKSIKIKPNELNYSFLGRLYFRNNAHLNAMLCFFEAITHNFLRFEPYFYLGLCAKRNTLFRSVINRFMDKLQSAHTQDPFFQTNLAAYKFVSNQSHKQMHAFLSNFMEERKKGGEETLYGDIANQLIDFGLTKQIIKKNKIFSLIFGVLQRAKEHSIKANETFIILIAQQASVNRMSFSTVFTSLYQDQISKTPKELQPFFLQFVVAEMVPSSPAQALKCFHKSLSYAQGDYEQFYAEFYKMIERDIEKLWPISIIANSIVDRQPLDQTNKEYVSEAMEKHSFLELGKYSQHLGAMAQIVNVLSQQQQQLSKLSFWEFHLFLAAAKSNHMIEGLAFNVQYPPKVYQLLIEQIRNEQETVWNRLQHLCMVYNQKGEIKLLKTKICNVMELYFDRFILNQKVKLIFNHFHPYIITESCHKQFAVILHRIKEYAQFTEYRPLELMEDLQNMFREGNKHTNKVFKVEYIERSNKKISSNNTPERISTIDYPNSQNSYSIATNQQERNEEQQYLQSIKQKTILNRRNSEQSILNTDESNFEYSIEQTNKLLPKNITKKYTKPKTNNNAKTNSYEPTSSQQQISDFQDNESFYKDSFSSCSDEWFSFTYNPNTNTKFTQSRKYRGINELFCVNTYNLIRLLSNQPHLRYVARHICDPINKGNCFKVRVELGDQVGSQGRGGVQARTLKWIQAKGEGSIVRWISDIALGISELQDLGIYHADLFFRNTIRVTKGNAFFFKIIDFDKAFKVNQSGKHDKSYESTKNLLDFWLKFRFDGRNSRAPMNFFDCQSEISDQTGSSTAYDVKDIIKYIFYGADEHLINELLAVKRESVFSSNRLGKCLNLLRQHMRDSHLKQYSALVQQLLRTEEKDDYYEFTDPHIASGIMEKLELLKGGDIDYIQFAEHVGAIGGVEMGEEQINE